MPKGRPHIPTDIARKLFIETAHRCACCGTPFPLEKAHIVPWRESKDHSLENLLCLCANCHEMADRDWDRETFYEYKKNPWVNRQDRMPTEIHFQRKIEELIGVLEDRALIITAKLESQYQTEVRRCLLEFQELHKKHIVALRAGQLIRAHDILRRINDLSYSLETSEASLHVRPGADYAMLSSDHYSRGALMCGYVVGECLRNSPRYSGQRELLGADPNHPKTENESLMLSRYAGLFTRFGKEGQAMSSASCPTCCVAMERLTLDESIVQVLMPFLRFARDGQGVQAAKCSECSASFAVQNPSGKIISELQF